MHKCVRIILKASCDHDLVYEFVQKHAQKMQLEGVVNAMDGSIVVVVCGPKKQVDDFLDHLHKENKQCSFDEIQVEPFLKDKDYRGVFRVIR